MLNSRPAIVVYAESPSRPAAIAVPKYRPDWAAAAPRVPAAAFAAGITVTTPNVATAATAPPISSRTRNDRLPGEPAPGTAVLVATLASFSRFHIPAARAKGGRFGGSQRGLQNDGFQCTPCWHDHPAETTPSVTLPESISAEVMAGHGQACPLPVGSSRLGTAGRSFE